MEYNCKSMDIISRSDYTEHSLMSIFPKMPIQRQVIYYNLIFL